MFLSWKPYLLVTKMIQSISFLTFLYWFPAFLFYCTIAGPGTEDILPHKRKRISSQGIACIPSAVPPWDSQFKTMATSVQESIQVPFLWGQCRGAQKAHLDHSGGLLAWVPPRWGWLWMEWVQALPWGGAGGPPVWLESVDRHHHRPLTGLVWPPLADTREGS